MGVEKVHFLQNSQDLGDGKCLEKPRKSFVGFLAQSFFGHFLVSEFFNSHRRLHSKPRSVDSQSELEVKSRFAIPRFLIAMCSPHRALRVGLLRRRSEKSWQNLCGSAEESVLSGPIRWENCANTGMFRVFRGKVLPCSVQSRLRGGEEEIRTLGTTSSTL